MMLSGSHGVSCCDEMHCAVRGRSTRKLWVAMAIVATETTTRRKKKCYNTNLGPGGGEEVHLWLDCLPVREKWDRDKMEDEHVIYHKCCKCDNYYLALIM